MPERPSVHATTGSRVGRGVGGAVVGASVGAAVGAGIGSAVGSPGAAVGVGTGTDVGAGTGTDVGALPSSSSHVQPLQSQPGPLSSWAQVIPLISSQVLPPMHVAGHEFVGASEYVGASVVGDGEGPAVVEKDPPAQLQQRSPAVKSLSS